MWTRTEPLRKYGATLLVEARLLEDEPVLTAAVERLKRTFNRGLEEGHLKVTGEVRYEQHDSDLMLYDQVRLVMWALTVRDPAWVESILAAARRAVEEDQAWLAEQRG